METWACTVLDLSRAPRSVLRSWEGLHKRPCLVVAVGVAQTGGEDPTAPPTLEVS